MEPACGASYHRGCGASHSDCTATRQHFEPLFGDLPCRVCDCERRRIQECRKLSGSQDNHCAWILGMRRLFFVLAANSVRTDISSMIALALLVGGTLVTEHLILKRRRPKELSLVDSVDD